MNENKELSFLGILWRTTAIIFFVLYFCFSFSLAEFDPFLWKMPSPESNVNLRLIFCVSVFLGSPLIAGIYVMIKEDF